MDRHTGGGPKATPKCLWGCHHLIGADIAPNGISQKF
jgi:hypothetical protein